MSQTLSQSNAIRCAENYLDGPSHFSAKSLLRQLKHEGYPTEDAEYAVQHFNHGALWTRQAIAAAKSYLRQQAFSRLGLSLQLAYEGYSEPQIERALRAVGY